MNPSGVMSTASYTAPEIPRPISRPPKLPYAAAAADTRFPIDAAHARLTR
jgi:hypothetical protein